jgi:hypothetical protein
MKIYFCNLVLIEKNDLFFKIVFELKFKSTHFLKTMWSNQ